MRKRNGLRIVVGALALLLLLMLNVVPTRVVHARPAGVPFRSVRHQLIVVSVFVNEDGPFDFLLDTGTNSTVVIPAVAARLRLRPIGRVSLITVAGSRVVQSARLKKLTLDAKSLEDVEVLIEDLREVRSLDDRVCGVLGQNFLSRFNYLLDYRNRRLIYEDESAAVCAGARLPAAQHEGRLMVTARLASYRTVPRRTLRLLLDSAATGTLFFNQPRRELAPDVGLIEGGRLKVSSNIGTATAQTFRARMLQVGEERFYDLPVALLESGVDSGGDPEVESGVETGAVSGAGISDRVEDGLLPTSLFHAIYFNHRDGHVILNPQGCGRG